MDKQRRYTAQEMREQSRWFRYRAAYSPMNRAFDVAEKMLQQAADAEEELAKVKASKNRWMQYQETAAGERNACIDELRKKDAEIAQLRARLAAKEARRGVHNADARRKETNE